MKKFFLLTKTLLVAVCLLVGASNVWAATETLSGTDATTKDNAIAKTSFTMLATYNPSGNTEINSKDCLKVRWARSDASTGNTNGFALKVNAGYMITKIEAQMSGNSSDLVLSDIKVDGVSYAGEYSKTLKGSGESPAYTNITLSGIAATDYINFEYSSGGSSSQGFVYITVTYEPRYYGVKNVFIGTAGAPDSYGVVNTVTAEDFEEMASLPAAWSNGGYNTVSIGNVAEVALPAVDGTATSMPTYVSGKTMERYQRQGGTTGLIYASYTLTSAVSEGKLVFGSDFCATNYLSNAIYFRFVDSDGNPVLTLNNNATSSNATNFQYAIGSGDATNTTAKSKWRTYNSFRITNLVIDFATGATTFTLDYINDSNIRKQLDISCNIGTGKNVKSIQVGRYCVSKTDIYTHMDNISLYQESPVWNYTINYTSGGDVIATGTGRNFAGETVNAAASVNVGGIDYTPSYGATTSLTVTSNEANNVLNVPVEASVPYTINYVYNDGVNDNIISSEEGYAIIGNSVDASITTSLWDSESTVKYYVANSATTSFDVTSSGQTFVVDLRLANTSAVAIVNAKCGGTTHKTFTATGIEGEDATVYYPIVVKSDVDSKFYTVSTNDYSKNLTYGASVDVNYTLDETIVGFTEIGSGTTSSQSCGGNTPTNSKLAEATVNAGHYRAEIMVISKAGSGSNHRQEGVFVADTRVASLSGNINGLRTLDFVVPTNSTNVYVRGLGSSNYSDNLDYVIIRKTADLPASVSKTITSAGYATYCSPYILDFSSSIANLTKAYIVTGTEGETTTLALTEITGTIPANTGILLEGEGEVSIPVATSSSTDVSANKLVGVTSDTPKAQNSIYVLMNEGGNVGFYKNANETDFTVGANTAYLPADFNVVNQGARAYFFRGNITEVENVEAAPEVKTQEGKFFENGKLIIVKAGKKFNANGQLIK